MSVQIMEGNGANFVATADNWRGCHQPMLLTAWTQTTNEDFELLQTFDPDSRKEEENRALREKVRHLELKLQEHAMLLSQIHATSAQATALSASLSNPHGQQLTPPNSIECPTAAQTAATYPHPQQHLVVIPPQNPPPPQKQHLEITDYKIVATADPNGNDADAIEIRLAAESLNSLSASSDSERLEICVGGEERLQPKQEPRFIKREHLNIVKRRRLGTVDPIYASTPTSTPIPTPLASPNPLQQHQQQFQNIMNGSIDLPIPTSHKKIKVKAELKTEGITKKEPSVYDNVMVSIGPNGTCVPAALYENINWTVSSLATRKLMVGIFDRETLATHSMTGKPSPAFKDQKKPLKKMLDPLKVNDIVFAVTRKSNASEKEVRNAITTKCADENKMMKIQKGKRSSIIGNNKENIR